MNKPSILLKIVNKKGEELLRMRSGKRRRISNTIQKPDFVDCLFTLSVTYINGIQNKTDLQPKKETLKALRIFLEK